MYMTAPMGVMQMVQTPLQPPATPTPQVVPAAQRLLASAIVGTPSAPATQADRKPLIEQTGNQPRGGNSTPEQSDPANESPASTTTRLLNSVAERREPPRLSWPSNASFAAQLMAQEDMGELALPAQTAIADMLKRTADKKSDAASLTLAALRQRGSNPESLTATPLVQSTLRRDVSGAVQVPRGAGAYAQASARMAKLAAIEDAPPEVLADTELRREMA